MAAGCREQREKSMTAFYCVVVDGPHKGGPRVAHSTLEIAEAEAARLHAKLAGQYAVRILETVRELPATAPLTEPVPKPNPYPTRCPATCPGGITPDGTLPKGTQCGLPAGHDGDHTVLIPTSMPWFRKPAQAVQASAAKPKVQAGAKPAQKAPVVVVKKKRVTVVSDGPA